MKIEQQNFNDDKKGISFAPLKVIKKIRFTDREIDVIACLTGGRSYKKTASFLSIAPRTVEHHVRNIIMRIGCNSREGIVDFIEKSNKFALIKTYYTTILVKVAFEQELKKLLPKTKEYDIDCLIFHDKSQATKASLVCQLKQHLDIAGIKTFSKIWGKNKSKDFLINRIGAKQLNCIIYVLSDEFIKLLKTSGYEIHKEISSLIPLMKESLSPIIFLLLDENVLLDVNKNQPNIVYVSLPESDNYYFLFFELFNKILPNHDIDTNIIKFKKQYEMLQCNTDLQEQLQNDSLATEPDDLKNNNQKKKKNPFIWLALLFVFFVGSSFAVFKVSSKKNVLLSHQSQNINPKSANNKQSNKRHTIAFNLPPRNNKFTGRKYPLAQIEKQFDKQKTGIITQVISGLGGVGKTQLATEFAYRTIEKGGYSLIFWISAETKDSIIHAYKELAEFLQVDIKGFDPNKIRSFIHHELGQKYGDHKILFILDNAPNYDSIQKYLSELHKQLLSYLSPNVLIISRSQHWPEDSITLKTFSNEEALAFTKKHLPREKRASIIKLANTLHYFPLALNQAIAYIKRHTNIDDYLKLYAIEQKVFLDKSSKDKSQYKDSLWKTWNITLNKLSGAAKEILFMSSYLYSEDIPIDFFDNLSIKKRLNAIEELRKHSFITLTNNNESFKIHRLLQEVVRKTVEANDGGIKEIISKVSTKKILKKTINSLKSKFDFSYTRIDKWKLCAKYLAQAKFLAEYLVNNSENKFFRINGIQLYAQVAMYLNYIRYDFSSAQKAWKKILNCIKRYHISEESNELIFANINMHMGCSTRAEDKAESTKYLKKALSFYNTATESMATPSDSDELLPYFRWNRNLVSYNGIIGDKINTLFCLGLSKQITSDLQGAENYFEKALNLLLSKKEIADYLIIYKVAIFSTLGKLYLLQGNVKKSENILNSAKLFAEKNFPNHVETAYVYERLAISQYHVGKYDDAIENLGKCLKIRSSTLSKDHFRIGYIKAISGLILCTNNQRREGIKNLQKAEAIYEKSLPKDHRYFLFMYSSIINAFEMNKNYDKALQYVTKARDLLKKYSGSEMYNLVSYHFPVTEKFPILKTTEKNLNYYRQALDLTKKLFGENHTRVARYYYLLGQIFENTNNKYKAKLHYQKALNIVNKQYFDDKKLVLKNKKNGEIIQKHLKKLNKE